MNILNLCVIASTKTDKYTKRLKNFIDLYGYKNLNYKKNTKISFLVEDESKPDFINESFGWYNYPNLPMSLRFVSYLINNWSPSVWTMQVDDDSSTDIDKTIEFLNQFYDADDSMILMGGRNTDLENGLQNLIKEMGEPNILFDNPNICQFKDIPYFVHAWEPSILSKKAVNKIRNYNKLEFFLQLARKYKPVFTDQSIYLLSKLAKVPIVESTFLCPYDRPQEYSAVNPNGRYSHIHYVKEESSNYNTIIDNMKKYNIIEDTVILNNMKYVFENTLTQSYGIIFLNENGLIDNYDNPNEKYWEFNENNNLIFKDINNKVTSIFTKNGDEYICEKKWHVLKPYDKVFPFTQNILEYKTDKFFHNHLAYYENKFKYVKNDAIKLVELGCLGGESIRYWLNYFPNGKIYGIDINKIQISDERFGFYQCNQNDRESLLNTAEAIGDIDIFIDDGSHYYDETKNTFDVFWPKIKSGGYYVIEDWDWMTDLITDIIHRRGELGGGVRGTRGIREDIGIKHLEVSTNDNRAYALFQKR
jgi:hypothetical protein